MQIQVGLHLIVRTVSVTLVILATRGVAVAADTEPEASRWIPSVSIYIAGLPEDRKARADNDASTESAFQDGESVGFPFSAGAELGLASPVLTSSGLKPRLTIHGGVGFVLDGDDPVTSEGEPGPPPEIDPGDVLEGIENVGSAVRVEAKDYVLTGGFGVLLEFEAFERKVFLRPTVEWMYRRDTVTAILGAAENELPPDPVSGVCNPCRSLYINSQSEKGYHSLGIGLEAELDGGRTGDFLVRMYASGRAYRILGDRKTDISATGTWMPSDGTTTVRNPPTTTMTARYEREPFHYRVGIGIRFLWSPE